jgi:leucyl-tRNA synthetase
MAILPKEKWPKGFLICGWVTQQKGRKISKSKGGAEPLRGIAEKSAIDAIRLYYAHTRSVGNDIEWNMKILSKYEKRINKIRKMLDHLMNIIETYPKKICRVPIDDWLISRISERNLSVKSAMEDINLREATNNIFFETYNDIKWYLRRGGANKRTLISSLNNWLKLMSPFAPYLSQEYWQRLGNNGSISSTSYPSHKRKPQNDFTRTEEEYLKLLMKDVRNIAKARKKYPKKIIIVTARPMRQQNSSKSMQENA